MSSPQLSCTLRTISYGDKVHHLPRPIPALRLLVEHLSAWPHKQLSLDELTAVVEGPRFLTARPDKQDRARRRVNGNLIRLRKLLTKEFGDLGWLAIRKDGHRSLYTLLPRKEATA